MSEKPDLASPSADSASLLPPLCKTKDSPKNRDSHSVPSEQCYEASEATNKHTKCYELPTKVVTQKFAESVYASKPRDLVTHQKKLIALKSSENVNLDAFEEGELNEGWFYFAARFIFICCCFKCYLSRKVY